MSSSPQGLRPAKIITPAIRQRLSELLAKARRMSRAEPCPHDEIDDLLIECVTVDPGNTVYIGALLHHLHRSDRPRRTGFQTVPTFFSRLVRTDPLRPIRQAAEAQNWEEVLTLAPRALCQQPQSVERLRHIASACAALEHEQAELCYLQAAVAMAPDDAETQRQLARALTRQGRFDEAAVAWENLAAKLGADDESAQTLKILRDHPPVEMQKHIVLAEEEERTIRDAIAAGTASQEQFRRLLMHTVAFRRFDEAEQVFLQAVARLRNSLQVQEWQEELTMMRGWNDWENSSDLAQLRPEYAKLPERKRAESDRIDLHVYYRRCERRPDNLSLQIQLARILNLNGNYSEAIKRLEPAEQVPELRAEALCVLGFSRKELGQLAQALMCFQESIDLATAAGDQETVKSALKLAARLADRTKRHELARNYYRRLSELPADTKLERTERDVYRLVLDRLNHLCDNARSDTQTPVQAVNRGPS